VVNTVGTGYLSRKLNHLLLNHIRECLPDIRARITHSISRLQTELAEYGDPVLASRDNKGAVLLQVSMGTTVDAGRYGYGRQGGGYDGRCYSMAEIRIHVKSSANWHSGMFSLPSSSY
jgi:hypothetical protein